MYDVILSKQALKDLDKLKQAGAAYASKAGELVGIVEENPYSNPPPYEKLKGDLQGFYSRKINDQHRFVYHILPNVDGLKDENGELFQGIVHVARMWTHYE